MLSHQTRHPLRHHCREQKVGVSNVLLANTEIRNGIKNQFEVLTKIEGVGTYGTKIVINIRVHEPPMKYFQP